MFRAAIAAVRSLLQRHTHTGVDGSQQITNAAFGSATYGTPVSAGSANSAGTTTAGTQVASYNHVHNIVSVGFDTNTFYIDGTNHRVGIGTTSPAQMLDISSTAPSFQMTDTTASAKSLRLVTDANVASFYEAAGAAGDILSLHLTDKRVGIGTTSPGYLLDVNGAATIRGTTLGLGTNPSNNMIQSFAVAATTAGVAVGMPSVRCFFVARDGNQDKTSIWMMSGNAYGTPTLTKIGGDAGHVASSAPAAGQLGFYISSSTLYVKDGSATNTTFVNALCAS